MELNYYIDKSDKWFDISLNQLIMKFEFHPVVKNLEP